MKRRICVLLCIVMLGGLMALPVSAAIFQVSYYNETIYAGGVVDMYAFAGNGGVEPFTYQWQYDVSLGDGHWYDLEDNDSYTGTKTNHLQLRTKPGSYEDWDQVPFQCVVTDAEGTDFCTPDLFMTIYPTEELIPDMKAWGYCLYEPTVTNVSGFYTSDYVNYTANAYAGSKLDISCGGAPAENRALLSNSEVSLKREIHITENGHTTKVGDSTTYIPYTVGTDAVIVEIKQSVTIAEYDLGYLDTKTIKISTSKPTVTGTAQTNTDCSLLRYTYNESQKLASIPKGTAVEVLGKEGSYYQVYYDNMIGYVGTSLLNTQKASYDPVIKNVDVTITAPVAGQTPDFHCQVLTEGCQLYHTEPVSWYDKTAKRYLTAADCFQESHSYNLTIWISAKDGYKFQVDASDNTKLKGVINGNLPPYINKAYEQDPEKVVELFYTFSHAATASAPKETHTCVPVLVERVEPTCTEAGFEAYYRCECGMHYQDSQGKTEINTSLWGKLPATGHTPSGWRTTQIVHYKACTACGDFLEEEDHSGGTATCMAQAKCKTCGNAYGELSDHRWSPTFLYQDSTGHAWICADCKKHSEVEPHTPGPAATETEPQTCKDCGYVITPVKNHTHKLSKVAQTPATCMQAGNMEYYTCDGCSGRFTDAAGKEKLPDTESIGIGALGHTEAEAFGCDTEYHWRSCAVCGEVLAETKMLHEIENGVCATCGYQEGVVPTAKPTMKLTQTPAEGEPTLPDAAAVPEATSASQTNVPEATNAAQTTVPQQEDTPKAKQNPPVNALAVVLLGVVSFSVAITTTVIIMKKKK